MPTAVAVNNVSMKYSKAADSGGVTEIDAQIPAGRFTTLLGESGSGKTTLLRLLAGFLRPSTGEISINGAIVASNSTFVPTQRRDLAMVFQSYALWPHMNVRDIVGFGLQARKTPKHELRERVAATLDLVGLGHLDARKPGQLSGGQQQRVALARSLVLEPSLLLLDEPLSNLDADLRQQMRNQLKDLQLKTGITFVYVTHDQEEAFALSDHLIVLDHGRILQQGKCGDLYHRPRTERVARFMGRGSLHLSGTITSSSESGCVFAANTDEHGHLNDIELANRTEPPLPAGARANVLVHSEDVHVLDDAARADRDMAVLHGEVEAVSFAGRERHIEIRVSDNCTVTVYEPVDRQFAIGQRLTIGFDRRDAWAYEPDPKSAVRKSEAATETKSLIENVR